MAIRRIDLLSCGNLDKTPIKTLDFDAASRILNQGSIDVIVGVGENKRSYTLSAVVYVHYILLKKGVEIFGHSWHSLGNFLEKP